MSDISSLQTVDMIVNKALLTIPEEQRKISDYDRFLEFAVDCLRDLRLLVTKDGKQIIKVTPNATNRIDFPKDCEEFVGLGIPVDGKVWLLTRDNEIIPTKTVVGIDESLDEEDGEGVDLPTMQYDSFDAKGGVNLHGYYTVDYRAREVIINATDRDELLFIYMSSGISNTGETYVPSKYVGAVVAYILWMNKEYDDRIPMNSKMRGEQLYMKQRSKIKRIEAPSLYEMLDAWKSKSMN